MAVQGSTAEIVASVSRCGEALQVLQGMLDLPRDELLRQLQAVQASFAEMAARITDGLEARDKMLLRIDDAAAELRELAAQVKVMDEQIRALRARNGIADADDPFAGRH